MTLIWFFSPCLSSFFLSPSLRLTGKQLVCIPVTAGNNIFLGFRGSSLPKSSSTLREEINPGTMLRKVPRPKFEVRTSPLRPPRLISWRCPIWNICARIYICLAIREARWKLDFVFSSCPTSSETFRPLYSRESETLPAKDLFHWNCIVEERETFVDNR